MAEVSGETPVQRPMAGATGYVLSALFTLMKLLNTLRLRGIL